MFKAEASFDVPPVSVITDCVCVLDTEPIKALLDTFFQEPRSLYEDVRFVPLTKLDKNASEASIRKYMEEEEGK